MGLCFFWLCLLLWSLLCRHSLGFQVHRAKRAHEIAEQIHISVLPTANVYFPLDRKDENEKKEEKIVNKLVVLLKETVDKVPTQRPSKKPPVITFQLLNPSPSGTDDTLWMNRTSKASSSTGEIDKTTTPFWRLRNDSGATIILYTATTPSRKSTPELLQSTSSATVVLHSDIIISETPKTTVSLLQENVVITGGESKTFNQLTKGSLSKLVASLKKMEKAHDALHTSANKPQQDGNHGSNREGHQHKPEAAHNLELIDVMVKTIKNSPPSVKNDPALPNNVDKAERLLQVDLKLAGEAEKRLKQAKDREEEKEGKVRPSLSPKLTVSEMIIPLTTVSSDQEQEKTREQQISPSPSPSLVVSEMTVHSTMVSFDSQAKKAEDMQDKRGKFKTLIELLYGFNGHADNPPNRKVARDIVNKTIVALNAIKTISSGKADEKSKKLLQDWLKKDMKLERRDIRGN